MTASAIITVPGTITAPSLGKVYRDALLEGANGGIPWLFDLAKTYSYPKQGAPVNGDAIVNLNESGNNGSVGLPAGQALSFAGGGLDFSAVTAKPVTLVGPAAAMADIWGGGAGAAATATVSGAAVTALNLVSGGSDYGSGLDTSKKWSGSIPLIFSGGGGAGAAGSATVVNGVVTALTLSAGGSGYSSVPTVTIVPGPQYFSVCFYMKAPSLADWNQSNGVATLFNVSGTTGGYVSDPELVNIGQVKPNAGVAAMIFNRQKALNSTDQIQLNVNVAHFSDPWWQIGVYRNASGQQARIRSASATSLSPLIAAGLPNVVDFSAKQPRLGIGNPFTSFASNPGFMKFRMYRAWPENLATSEREPLSLWDADFARQAARGAFL